MDGNKTFSEKKVPCKDLSIKLRVYTLKTNARILLGNETIILIFEPDEGVKIRANVIAKQY